MLWNTPVFRRFDFSTVIVLAKEKLHLRKKCLQKSKNIDIVC